MHDYAMIVLVAATFVSPLMADDRDQDLCRSDNPDADQRPAFHNVTCEGTYPHHLQGICVDDIVGGLPDGVEKNNVYEYDGDFVYVKKHIIKSGHTHLGIQTAAFANDRWWLGCYGDPKILLVTDADFNMKARHPVDCSLGIVGLSDGRFLAATGRCGQEKGCTGSVKLAVPDEESGLRYIGETEHNGDDDVK